MESETEGGYICYTRYIWKWNSCSYFEWFHLSDRQSKFIIDWSIRCQGFYLLCGLQNLRIIF